MDFENIKEGGAAETASPLEKIADNATSAAECYAAIDEPIDNPYASGFDAEHPMPTYEQLRNAGFSEQVATSICYGPHSYSDRELFEVLYSDNPVEAYHNMIYAKIEESSRRTEDYLSSGPF